MKQNKKVIHFLFTLLLPVLFLSACGGRTIGYGVLLWENEFCSYKTGAVIRVFCYSLAQESYLIYTEKAKEKSELPQNWLIFFKQKSEAVKYAKHYTENFNYYGIAVRDGLPVRESLSKNARMLYKLSRDELVKILDRSDQKEKISSYENYWYKIITKKGNVGYTYGEFLTVFESGEDPTLAKIAVGVKDALLERVTTQKWRPAYFKEMMDDEIYDLNKFKDEIGFFLDTELKVVKIVTDEYSLTFPYTEIKETAYANYLFLGSDLRVKIVKEDKISVTYNYNNNIITDTYMALPENIAEVVTAEQKRRASVYALFQDKALSSSAYGSLSFGAGKRFTWEGYDRLVPAVVPGGAGSVGAVIIQYYVGKALAYDGVITLIFAAFPQKELNFLFKFKEDGVNFVYVNPAYIKDLVIDLLGGSPLVLFFKFP